jgi:hypothetical protein
LGASLKGLQIAHCKLPIGLLVTTSFSIDCAVFFYKLHRLYSNRWNISDKSINTCEKLFYRLIRRRATFVQVLTNNCYGVG